MSKKYVIEIKPEYEDTTRGIMVLGSRDSNLYVDALAFEDLEELNSDYINEHFGDLQDTAYQRGVEDGQKETWEAAKTVALNSNDGGLSIEDLDEIFDCYTLQQVFKKYTAQQTIAKLKAYEEKQKADEKIKVGDEVIYNGTTKCIVVRPEDDERYASLIDCDGTHYSADHRECKKTGRHFDIEKILEEMKK